MLAPEWGVGANLWTGWSKLGAHSFARVLWVKGGVG